MSARRGSVVLEPEARRGLDSFAHIVEHPGLAAERIGRFVRVVRRAWVIASADCVLAVALAKLASLVKGAPGV